MQSGNCLITAYAHMISTAPKPANKAGLATLVDVMWVWAGPVLVVLFGDGWIWVGTQSSISFARRYELRLGLRV